MATIKFLLRGESEKTPIYLRLSIGRGNTPRRKTGLFIDSREWSDKTGFPKQNNPHNKKLKSNLQKLETHILDQYNTDFPKGITINGDWLGTEIDSFFNQGKKQEGLNRLTDYIEYFVTTLHLKPNSKGGLGLSRSRENDYKALLRLLREFEGSSPILIKDVNLAFKTKFLNWMMEKKNYSKGYTGRRLQDVKTVCLDAEVNGIETHPQLKKVTGFRVKNEFIIYLTEQEQEQIQQADLPHDYLDNARRWLLLGCNIGQRGNDILDLTEDNITFRNGLEVIELEQQKTGKKVALPVSSKIEEIIKEGMPRKISLQKFNDYIKEVCRLAGVNTLTKGKKQDPKTKRNVTGEFEKWELVTSHICRRSFATNHFGKIPTPLIMQITAHSSEKTFYGYIGKTSFDYAQQIADFYAKEAAKEKKEPQLHIIKTASNQ